MPTRRTDSTPLREAGYIQRLKQEQQELQDMQKEVEDKVGVTDDVVRRAVRLREIEELLRQMGVN